MKLSKRILNELVAIISRVGALEKLAFSNYPESKNFVLESFTQELTSYKINVEEMFEKTDKKEWLILIRKRLFGLIKQF